MTTPLSQLRQQAHELGMDVERLMRQEQLNGHLSPTDSAILQRVSRFLLHGLPDALPEDPASTGFRGRIDPFPGERS